MLPLALILLFASFILFVFTLRGRATVRGRFCNKCKFDLAGLDKATCPECGRDLTSPKATRPAIRRLHQPALWLAILLLLAGGFLLASTRTPLGPIIARQLPDPMILRLTELGWDDALLELINRTNGQRTLDPAIWDTVIERGLAHQADTATPWDPRWGAVLHHAAAVNRMSEDQLSRYLVQAVDIDIRIRGAIAADQPTIPFQWSRAQQRITSAGFGQVGTDPIVVVLTKEQFGSRKAAADAVQPSNPSTNHASDTVISSTIANPAHNAGDHPERVDIEFTFEIEMLANANSPRRVLETRTITKQARVVGNPLELIERVTDPAVLQSAAASITVSPIAAAPYADSKNPNRPNISAFAVWIRADSLPAPISGRLVIQSEGYTSPPSEPFLLNPQPDELAAAIVHWRILPSEARKAFAVTEAALRNGKATILLQIDTDQMLANATIDRFLDIGLVFSDVPVIAAPGAAFDTAISHPGPTTRAQLQGTADSANSARSDTDPAFPAEP
ncbi:MAG: hypothetical protein LAT64_01955 [Phycisphaerales bacterium]|nr:hypothetical protein [Planctomycetota bacterium]MCH8507523.1 hypothetical protein [Phycisphaerales bacterium]